GPDRAARGEIVQKKRQARPSVSCTHLFAVHLYDQSSNASRIDSGKFVQAFYQAVLADRTNLVDGDLRFSSNAGYRDAAAPARVQLSRKGTDDDGVQIPVHLVPAD